MRLAYKQRPFKTYIKISHSPSFMAAIKALGGIEFRGKVKFLFLIMMVMKGFLKGVSLNKWMEQAI